MASNTPWESRKIAAGQTRRSIPDDYKYNTKKVKNLKRILHNVSVALGTLTSALNEFSRMKGPEVSPDGMLGGVGYIMPLKEIKGMLNTSVHNLSDLADCIADELSNPKWQATEDEEVKELIKEKDEAVEKVEEVQEEVQDEDIDPKDVVTVGDVGDHVELQQQKQSDDEVGRIVSAAVRRRLIELRTT